MRCCLEQTALDALASGKLAGGMLFFVALGATTQFYRGALEAKLRNHLVDGFGGLTVGLIRHRNS